MKNKKYILSLMFIGITLLLGFFYTSLNDTNKLRAQELEATISDNLFQDVKIVMPSESNRVLTQEDYLKNDSEVKVSMTFKFTNKNYKAGDTFITTLPEGFTYKEVIEGELGGTALYRIDPATRKLALTMTKNVQAAEYTLELTTRIKFDTSLNSKQQMLFGTQTPTTYILHLYVADAYIYKYGKAFDDEGNETDLMPAKGGAFSAENVNYKHIDLATNNLEMVWSTRTIPSYWKDGYVNITNDLNSYKFYTYETTINGEQIGEKRELKAGEDFAIIPKSEGTVQLKFNERFHEALEVSEGEMIFDYSDFNPSPNGNNTGRMQPSVSFNTYSSSDSNKSSSLSLVRFYVNFYVIELGYLGLGSSAPDTNVKDREPIVKTPIYINGTNQQLKKGDSFVLTNEGDPSLVNIDTKLAQEYSVTLSKTGAVKEGTKKALSNWKISSDAFGKITLTYLGEDTTESVGLDIYVGRVEVKNWTDTISFVLSGNGYQATNIPKFQNYDRPNKKSGSFNTAKSSINWSMTVNSLYQKITKLTDTFGFGVKAGTLKSLTISSVEFGKNGVKKDLVEGIDYEFVDNSEGFEIKLLKETKEKLTISYDTDVDMSAVTVTNLQAVNTITPTFLFTSSDEKEYPTVGYAYIPEYLVKNNPYLLSENKSSNRTNKIGQQPINQVRLLINPNGSKLVNNEVIANYKTLDVAVLNETFTVNQVKQFSTTDYTQLLPGAEIAVGSKNYPEFIIENNQIRVKNKELTEPIIVSFTLAKNNSYNVVGDYVKLSQVTNGSEPNNSNAALYYSNILPSSFITKTSLDYVNIAEGVLTIDKLDGSALIKGTRIDLGAFYPNDGMRELTSLREVTDEDGKILPKDSVTISINQNNWYVTINNDQLTNGLAVKLKWSFGSSGTKTYRNGGFARHPYVNGNNATVNAGYIRYSAWSGQFDIDNSGAGGNGSLILTDLTINAVDTTTQAPVAGATYEIIDTTGKVVTTATTNSNGQIILKDYVVANYTLKEVKAPDGYLTNEEYNDSGKEITLSNTEKNDLTIPYVKKGKIIVHFTYKDGTDIEAIEPITISGGVGTAINIKEQEKVKEQLAQMKAVASDYRFLSYDQGAVSGTEEAAVIPYDDEVVSYKYEGLLTLQVPELLTFESGFVSPFTQLLSYENQDDFKISLRDNRQITGSTTTGESKTRGNIRLNAALSQEFKTSQNKVLREARLFYYNGESNVLLNGVGGNLVTNRQDTVNPNNKDFTFILDTATSKNEGFKLEVPAKGTLADEYIGEVTWEIIQEP